MPLAAPRRPTAERRVRSRVRDPQGALALVAAVIKIAKEGLMLRRPERRMRIKVMEGGKWTGRYRRERIWHHQKRVRRWEINRGEAAAFFREEKGIFEAACEAGGQDVQEARAAIARRAGMLAEELEP